MQIMRLLALAWLLTTAALTTYAPPPLRVLETPTPEEVAKPMKAKPLTGKGPVHTRTRASAAEEDRPEREP